MNELMTLPVTPGIIRANYEMTREEAELIVGLMDRAAADHRFYLLKLRDEKGYKALGYETFEEFGEKRCGLAKSRLYQLAEAAEIQQSLSNSTMVEKIPERHLRPLAPLTDDERRKVWEEATAKATEEGKKLTAKAVQDAVDELTKSKESWRTQAIETKRKADEAAQQVIAKQKENKALRDTIAQEAENLAYANTLALKAKMTELAAEKLETENKLKQERKAQKNAIAEGVTQRLKEHQDEITTKELQLSAIERRIATLRAEQEKLELEFGFAERHKGCLTEADRAINNLSLAIMEAFDEDHKNRFDIPATIYNEWSRIANELMNGANLLQQALGNIRIEKEVPSHAG